MQIAPRREFPEAKLLLLVLGFPPGFGNRICFSRVSLRFTGFSRVFMVFFEVFSRVWSKVYERLFRF